MLSFRPNVIVLMYSALDKARGLVGVMQILSILRLAQLEYKPPVGHFVLPI